jgi:flagellar protein FlaJ
MAGKFTSQYKTASVLLFGGLADRFNQDFSILKPHLSGSGIHILLKTWVSIIFMTTAVAFFGSLAGVVAFGLLLGLDAFFFIYVAVFVPILSAAFTFLIFYTYPIQKAKSIKKSIENDMPFALTQMNAIASSGIPPEFMFELLIGFKEYGAISEQAEMVVRNIKTFGMSSVKAMNDVADKTPSEPLKQLLQGMSSTIEKGGDLIRYLSEMSEKALFDYRIKREKYLKTLSTYADIYTALLVAAPLMMLSVLGIMNIIGGTVMGLGIPDLITLLTFVALPVMNIAFLTFVHITYPGI